MHRLAAALVAAALVAPAAHAADRFVDVAPQVRIHVVDEGAPSAKPALVLVPGWTFGADVWRREIDRFARDRRVIAIDPRSQGQSTKTGEGDTPEQRARDLKAVLDQLHAGPIVLVGWSQGVQDVAAYVGQFGTDALRGVVLVDSTVSSGAASAERDPKGTAEQLARFDLYAKHPRDYLQGMMGFIIRKPQPNGAVDRLIDSSMQTPPAIGVAMLIADFFGEDRTGALKKLDRPTLIIAAGYSPELAEQKAMAAALPHARFEVVEDAGHAVFLDQPEKFDALLTDLLAKLS
jgi:microsomal epoxide hydrolase